MANDEYLLAIAKDSRLAALDEIGIPVPYCGLDAWFEDEEVEFRRFAGMFRRLRN
jgi:hypothetical protein